MTALDPQTFADDFAWSVSAHDALSPRSQQTLTGRIGMSDMGGCQQRVAYQLKLQQPTDATPHLAAFVGNAVDERVKAARRMHDPELEHDVAVVLTLPNGAEVRGTLDECDPREPSVTDVKTKPGLQEVRRYGADRNHHWQRTGYYGALHQLDAERWPATGVVRNIYLDRSGRDESPHVDQAPFDPNVIHEMSDWLDGAMQAAIEGRDAEREMPRVFCARFCQFFSVCRAGEVQQGPITNEVLARKVDDYAVTKAEIKRLTDYADELRPDLQQVTGVTERTAISSTWVNRANGNGYWRIETSAR